MTWKERKLNYFTDQLEELQDQLEELQETISEKHQELASLELKDDYLNILIKALEKEIEELKEKSNGQI